MVKIEETNENNVIASKKEIVDLLVYSTLILSFITFNIVMAYSLINRFQSNNEPLQIGAVLLLLTASGALLAFGSLFYREERDRRSGKFEKDKLLSKDYLVFYAVAGLLACGFYALSLLSIGVGTIVDLVQHGLNDNNKILLAGVVGAVACSLLMALYSCVLEPLLSKKMESSKNSETIESVAVSNVEGNPHIAEQRL
ncbi:MAG: hypothetical protein U0X86_000194 [Wolbachia endosymbiont of Xenopsylla cheopis]